MERVVAAVARLTVVELAVRKLKEPEVEVKSPPLTARSPTKVTSSVRLIVTVSVAVTTALILVPSAKVTVLPAAIGSVVLPSVIENKVDPVVKQVEHPTSPRADKVIGEEADTATVPEALGKLMVLSAAVGSVKVRKV